MPGALGRYRRLGSLLAVLALFDSACRSDGQAATGESQPDDLAATSLTLSNHQEPFAIELLQRMQDSNIVRIGDAFQEAKQSLEIEYADGLREISDTFALFGDPSTLMVRP